MVTTSMRERWETAFHKRYPDYDFNGPIGKEDWLVWSEGYVAGLDRAAEIIAVNREVASAH